MMIDRVDESIAESKGMSKLDPNLRQTAHLELMLNADLALLETTEDRPAKFRDILELVGLLVIRE
jgi:hypothetical protein